MKKIVGLSLALILVIGVIGVATFAYFTDTETSSGNQLVAGTLDLKTNDADGVSQTLYATNMSPGDTVGPSTITLKNAGTTDGATLDIVFSYAESDGSPNSVNKTADEVAAMIVVDIMTYGGSSLLGTGNVTDLNGNSTIDIQDVSTYFAVSNTHQQVGIDGNTSKPFVIKVHLSIDAGNDYQADGIIMTMTFTLKQ